MGAILIRSIAISCFKNANSRCKLSRQHVIKRDLYNIIEEEDDGWECAEKKKKGAVSAPDQSVEPVETTTNALQKQQSKILCAANVVCWLMADAGNLRAGSNTIPSQYTLLLVYTVFQRHPRVHHHRPALEKIPNEKVSFIMQIPG